MDLNEWRAYLEAEPDTPEARAAWCHALNTPQTDPAAEAIRQTVKARHEVETPAHVAPGGRAEHSATYRLIDQFPDLAARQHARSHASRKAARKRNAARGERTRALVRKYAAILAAEGVPRHELRNKIPQRAARCGEPLDVLPDQIGRILRRAGY